MIEGALLRTQVGGKVEIVSAVAPASGALVVIDDDGPDMHYMVIITDFLTAKKLLVYFLCISIMNA